MNQFETPVFSVDRSPLCLSCASCSVPSPPCLCPSGFTYYSSSIQTHSPFRVITAGVPASLCRKRSFIRHFRNLAETVFSHCHIYMLDASKTPRSFRRFTVTVAGIQSCFSCLLETSLSSFLVLNSSFLGVAPP